jgi:hypothetical protein
LNGNVGYHKWEDVREQVQRWRHWFANPVLADPTPLEQLGVDIPAVVARSDGVTAAQGVVSACSNLCSEVVMKVPVSYTVTLSINMILAEIIPHPSCCLVRTVHY